jgi:hypothetical protein
MANLSTDQLCDSILTGIIHIINGHPLAPKHVISVSQCKLQDGSQLDFAMLCMLKESTWKPNKKWDGCCVYKELKGAKLILVQDMVHGVHVIPTQLVPGKKSLTYLKNTVDNDDTMVSRLDL